MDSVTQKKIPSPPHIVIDGVMYRQCGEGRKQRRAGSVECGEIKPVETGFPINNSYEDGRGIVCITCCALKDERYGERVKNALVPIKVYKDVPLADGTCRGVLVERDGQQVYGLVLPEAYRYLGLDGSAQKRRLEKDPVLSAGLLVVKIATSQGAVPVDVLCHDLVPLWLAGIETAKMRNRERAKQLENYQRVCAQVLADYFYGTQSAPSAPIVTPKVEVIPEVTGTIIRIEEKVDLLHGKVDNIERRLDRITTMTELVVCTGFVYVAAFDHTLPFDVQSADAMLRKGYVLVAIGETTKPVAKRLQEYVGKLPIRPPRLLKAIGTDDHKRAEGILHNERPADVYRAYPTNDAAQRNFRDLFWARVDHLELLARLPNQIRCDDLGHRLRAWCLRDEVYVALKLWGEGA